MKTLFVITLLLCCITLPSLFAQDPPKEANLPKVLIIGDSISIGYTPHVKQLLKGKADVSRIKGNAQHTGNGLVKIDSWLGDTKWDVIHFNWGLWDLCYRNPDSKAQGKRDKLKGKVTYSLKEYEENLEKLVIRLKITDAKLVWAHTTFIPDKEVGRIMGDDKKYNDVATTIMEKHGVAINDLNSLSKDFTPDFFIKAGDVHYTKKGSQKLAEQVVEKLLEAIGDAKEDGASR